MSIVETPTARVAPDPHGAEKAISGSIGESRDDQAGQGSHGTRASRRIDRSCVPPARRARTELGSSARWSVRIVQPARHGAGLPSISSTCRGRRRLGRSRGRPLAVPGLGRFCVPCRGPSARGGRVRRRGCRCSRRRPRDPKAEETEHSDQGEVVDVRRQSCSADQRFEL